LSIICNAFIATGNFASSYNKKKMEFVFQSDMKVDRQGLLLSGRFKTQ
jgi:hypothetical protein